MKNLLLLTTLFFGLNGFTALATESKLNFVELESRFDRFFSPLQHSYTGAVVTVVHEGDIALQKSYGYRDAERTQPVDASTTRFRLASTTKTLVAVAIAQLFDRGLIDDIDDPVNKYLRSWQLPANDGHEITLRMLATHQAGFAESRQPFQRAGTKPPHVNGAYLASHRPPYIRAVNSGANYSNYGIDVLANVITELTDQSFSSFVQQNIFDPLGMTTAIIVDAPEAQPDMAEAQIIYSDGSSVENPRAWANNPMNTPSGALAASGADMSKFMIALLSLDSDITDPKSRQFFLTRLGETHPLAQGYGLIFMHNEYNGHTLIEHGGSTLGNISYTTLVPELELGIFVSITGRAGTSPPGFQLLGIVPTERDGPVMPLPVKFPGFFDARSLYLETLLGLPQSPLEPGQGTAGNLSDYVGTYTSERRSERSVTRLFQSLLLGSGLAIEMTANDGLRIGGIGGYQPVGGDVFWRDPRLEPRISTGWRDFYAFTRDAQGQVVELVSQYTDAVYVKRSGLQSPNVQTRVLLIGSAILISGILLPLYTSVRRREYIPAVLALCLIALPFCYFAFWPRLGNEAISYVSITSKHLIPLQLMGNFCALLMLALPLQARFFWTGAGSAARIHYATLLLAVIPTLWAFWQFDLIGWHLD